jgi:hypothetical protein
MSHCGLRIAECGFIEDWGLGDCGLIEDWGLLSGAAID